MADYGRDVVCSALGVSRLLPQDLEMEMSDTPVNDWRNTFC